MDDRQLIADLLSALEYHTEQTRPIDLSKAAIQAAREYLRKPPQRKPLTFEQVEDCFPEGPSVFEDAYGDKHTSPRWLHAFARAIEAAHGIKE